MQVFPASEPAPVNAHVWIRHPPLARDGNAFLLRAVAPVPSDIPVATREWCARVLVELVPQAPLPASSRFEVWLAPQAREAKPVLLASFSTGTVKDTSPPGRPTFTAAVHEVASSAMCGTSHDVALSPPSRAETLYAAWAAKDGAIAWDGPPLAVFAEPRFGPEDTCMQDFAAWAGASPRIGIRAMDVAGNLGEPIELQIQQK